MSGLSDMLFQHPLLLSYLGLKSFNHAKRIYSIFNYNNFNYWAGRVFLVAADLVVDDLFRANYFIGILRYVSK